MNLNSTFVRVVEHPGTFGNTDQHVDLGFHTATQFSRC